MRVFAILVLFLTTLNANAQNITLRVLGKATYVKYAETNGIVVSFNKNESDKITKFSDTLSVIGVNNKLIPILDGTTGFRKKFRIEEKDLNLFDKLLLVCNDLRVKIDKVYYKLPEHRFKNEDKNAILAINNATSQARIIANNLNCKIVRILNIDDETTYASPFYDRIDMESENWKLIVELLQMLGGRNSFYSTESSKPTRNGAYSILVTYELEKK